MVLGAVGHWTAAEAVALLITREATTHAVAAHVHLLASFEITNGDLVAQFEPADVIDAVFAEVAQKFLAGLGEVTLGGFVDQLVARFAEADLNGGIAVCFRCFELGDAARARLDQSDRDGFALLVEELGHTQLLPKDADGHGEVRTPAWTASVPGTGAGVLIVVTQS